MIRRLVFIGVGLVCLAFFFSFIPGKFLSKSALAEKAKPSAIQKEPALIIEKIYVKGNRVFVTINRKGGGKVAPDDYSKIKMRIETSKGPRQWSLVEVDRSKILSGGNGKVEFDTGIVLEKGETVKAVLSLGKWETSRRDTLSIMAAPAGTKAAPSKMAPSKMTVQGKSPAQTPSQMNSTMARVINARSATPTPTPRNLDDAGGIRIIVPGEGQTQRQGDSLRVQAFFLNELSNPTAVDYVEFALRKWGVSDVFATHRQPYRQSSDDRNCVATIRLPATGLPPGSNYYFTATHPEAWGIGNNFTIQSPGEGLIQITRPRAGEGWTPGFMMEMSYRFTSRVAPGHIRFELYKLDADGRYGRPVSFLNSNYTPQPAGTPDPNHTKNWLLPRDLAVGRYFVLATHPEAWGKSSNFEVQWEREGHDFPSDYAVADIFKRGDDIKARIRATGGDMADNVELSVNGVLRREMIRPARDTDIVIGEIPSGNTCGAFYEVRIDPNNRFRETNRDNNNLRKFIPFRGADGHASVLNTSSGFATANPVVLIPCDEQGSIHVKLHNCSSESVSMNNIVEVRQVGWINPTTELNEVRPYRIDEADCAYWGGGGPGRSIPPGGCADVRVGGEDLRRVTSTLVLTFRGDVTAWPSLPNPLNIELVFGHWATVIHTDGGGVTRTCEYW